jgi:hypothetical protein
VKQAGNEVGKVSPRSGIVMFHPLTRCRIRPLQWQALFRLPEKIASKGVPAIVKLMGGGNIPYLIPLR